MIGDPVTAADVLRTGWRSMAWQNFERGGYGQTLRSVDWPELTQKIWRPTSKDIERRALYVGDRSLGLFHVPDGKRIPLHVYAQAAELLTALGWREAS